MTTPKTSIGRGVIAVSRSLTAALFPDLLAIDDCTIQGEMKAQGVFAAVHRTLLLPDSYTIVAIFYGGLFSYYSPQGIDWLILVDSPAIPLADEGALFPRITPHYCRNADGTNTLTRIDVGQ